MNHHASDDRDVLATQVAEARFAAAWFQNSQSFDIDLPNDISVDPTPPTMSGGRRIGASCMVFAKGMPHEIDNPTGQLDLWVIGGRLDSLEYSWFSDEMPDLLPDLDQLQEKEPVTIRKNEWVRPDPSWLAPSERLAPKRYRLVVVAAAGALVMWLSFAAVILGLVALPADWSDAMTVHIRSTALPFQHAWQYMVPAVVILTISLVATLGSLVALVVTPQTRPQTHPHELPRGSHPR